MAGVSKQLTCPRCEQVMAAAVFRVFGGLRITTPDGFLLSPVRDDLLLQLAEQRLESASTEDYPDAKRRRDFIVRNAGDRFYDIKCPGGHYTHKTAPQITRAILRAAGDQRSAPQLAGATVSGWARPDRGEPFPGGVELGGDPVLDVGDGQSSAAVDSCDCLVAVQPRPRSAR